MPSIPTGKLSPAAFDALIASHLGAPRSEVLLGPRPGCDSAIVRVSPGRVMAITADPLSLVPALGPELSARLAVRLVASDLWTTGIAPQYATVSLHLPPELDDATLGAYARAMSDEWAALGVAVVAGHTGRYEGCDLTIVGAATLVGLGDEALWIAPGQASPGDRVIVTRGCAIEATAIAARLFPKRLWAKIEALAAVARDPEAAAPAFARAEGLIEHVSVIPECRTLLALGVRARGVTALHDATEGGVLGGLVELARACGHDLRVHRAALPVSLEARAACEVFGIDPLWTLSEGTLIACVRPERTPAALEALERAGVPAAHVGNVVEGGGGLRLVDPDGAETRIDHPEPDPYWDAYDSAVREGWA